MREYLDMAVDFYQKLRLGYIKANDLLKYILEDKNKKALEFLKNQIISVIKEIKPKKGQGYIKFGSGDPYDTGRAMELAALFYPYYESFTEVIPEFEEPCLEVKQHARGRLRLFVPIMATVKILTSKELREIYKHFCAEAKELKQDIKVGEE